MWHVAVAGVADEHPDDQRERLHPKLPIYGNRAAHLCVYVDHEPRMPWQVPAYYVVNDALPAAPVKQISRIAKIAGSRVER